MGLGILRIALDDGLEIDGGLRELLHFLVCPGAVDLALVVLRVGGQRAGIGRQRAVRVSQYIQDRATVCVGARRMIAELDCGIDVLTGEFQCSSGGLRREAGGDASQQFAAFDQSGSVPGIERDAPRTFQPSVLNRSDRWMGFRLRSCTRPRSKTAPAKSGCAAMTAFRSASAASRSPV